MEVGIHANIADLQTNKIASVLGGLFNNLSKRLNGSYGGTIEHLWIDFELVESYAKPNGQAKYPFRFAKRVSGRSSFGLSSSPDYENVGHFSVRPDFTHLLSISKDEVILYSLNLIYKAFGILKTKEKKLGGFDSELFRKRFVDECEKLGYHISSN